MGDVLKLYKDFIQYYRTTMHEVVHKIYKECNRNFSKMKKLKLLETHTL